MHALFIELKEFQYNYNSEMNVRNHMIKYHLLPVRRIIYERSSIWMW